MSRETSEIVAVADEVRQAEDLRLTDEQCRLLGQLRMDRDWQWSRVTGPDGDVIGHAFYDPTHDVLSFEFPTAEVRRLTAEYDERQRELRATYQARCAALRGTED